ncbi:metalloendoproteinase 5-MMP-like [Mercurialis annua]|uniref:metalloendoproteinase 5-MMP-like n=1 Tax=Mercurialis annua TaxID=3986 RepID=UPI00215FB493|nr:metalloendoproteinase 5-MMP-like [Mercurialis annua]
MYPSKIISLLSLLFLAIQVSIAQTQTHENSTSSPFDFLTKIQGSQKGQNVNGVKDLKKFLKKFGYLDSQSTSGLDSKTSNNNDDGNTDVFDEKTESAIKLYQKNFNLNQTGILDSATLSLMTRPRCGRSDKNIRLKNAEDTIKPDFKFYTRNEKWTKTTITYGFMNGTPKIGTYAIRVSLAKWAKVTKFTFQYTDNYDKADLKFSFQKRKHLDNDAFDGPGGVYAHAWAPPVGHVHFDSEEPWKLNAGLGSVDLYTIALHEIGHALGLEHSDVQSAVMWPYVGFGEIKDLGQDDIQGIKALYNLK